MNADRRSATLLIVFLALIPVLQLVVSRFFDNSWAFNHWQFLSWPYVAAWLIIFAAAAWVAFRPENSSSDEQRSSKVTWGIATLTLILLVVFRFDLFVFGGGNLRVAEFAQREVWIFPWFEYGTTAVVGFFYSLISVIGLEDNATGVWAWRMLTYLCAALSLVGATQLAGMISQDKTRRILLFAILFFGPHVLPFFGFIGYAPIVPTVTIWSAYCGYRAMQRKEFAALLGMWAVLVIGVIMHISLVYLLPFTVFITLARFIRGSIGHGIGTIAGLLVLCGLTAGLYVEAGDNLRLVREILLLDGKNPFTNYSLFSGQHLGDIIQLLIGFVPHLLAGLLLTLLTRLDWRATGAIILTLSGVLMVFIYDPSNGIPSDLPILLSYLFGAALLLALSVESVVQTAANEASGPAIAVRLATVLSFGVLLSFVPVYVSASATDEYLTDYYDKNREYYAISCYAFRDAYFYLDEFKKADQWEIAAKRRSEYVLRLDVIQSLMQNEEYADALRELQFLRPKYPYKVMPYQLTARAQLTFQRFALAKPQIDTCFMLEPYGKAHFNNLYIYYRDQQKYVEAVQVLNRALDIYAGDIELLTDLMVARYRMQDFPAADSLSRIILEQDESRPYPYLIKGLMLDSRGIPQLALDNYERFVELAPEAPEAEIIRRHIDSLKTNR